MNDGGTSRLTAKPAAVILRRGGTAEITVDVVRGSDVTGTITARLADLPAGVTATTAMLAPPSTSATLKLSATTMATLGPQTAKLFADGTPLPSSDVPILVADSPGSLDVTWDGDGLVNDATRNMNAVFYAVAVQPDQYVIAGGASGAPLAGWTLRRYLANGVPDTSFNTLAMSLPGDGELRAIAFDAAGRIVCVGASSGGPAMQAQVTVARVEATGALDKTFGAGAGIVRLPAEVIGSSSTALGVAIQPDGAVVVAGLRREGVGSESGILARFKSDGSRDAAFNGGATIVVPASRFVGVALDGDAIFAGGSSSNAAAGAIPSYVLVKRTGQGAPDTTFANAGTATFGNTFSANGFARLPDGLLAVVGDVSPPGQASYTGGVMTTKAITQFARGFATAPGSAYFGVAAQDATLVVAVGHTAGANDEARVGRFSALDGKPDPSFSDAGTAIIEQGAVANGFDVTLFATAVERSGRILAVGNRSNMGAVIYRLWP